MATFSDIAASGVVNLTTAIVFLVAFAILRLQPFNDRVYFPKWYLKGSRGSPTCSGGAVNKFVNLDFKTYIRFLNWMPAALRMPEPELIAHAGLDSAVYVRIYLLGWLCLCEFEYGWEPALHGVVLCLHDLDCKLQIGLKFYIANLSLISFLCWTSDNSWNHFCNWKPGY